MGRRIILLLAVFMDSVWAVKIYPFQMDSIDHPDYYRFFVKHPTRATFENTVLFATLRGFPIDDSSSVIDYSDLLKQYCTDPETGLGTVVWPMYPLLFTTNFNDVVGAIQGSGLFVTDIWGFVPGSGPGNGSLWRENIPQQFYPPPEALAFLESSLGDRWLGMDMGEQDGRYVGGYSGAMTPSDRRQQYINFRDFMREMENILGPKVVALVSLTFPHYMVRSGLYTLVGAEAAQALPNSQVFYAFIRGAGKQYGVLWFGNVSVYNRFGYKTYPSTYRPFSGTAPMTGKKEGGVHYQCSNQNDGGPTCGTSLNLMKRLMYAHIMYGSAYVSFENGWFTGSTATLSPIGHIQYGAKQLIEQGGPLGVHIATIALLLDFFTGFCPPRNLYTSNLFRSWGNMPYSDGDYLADNLLRLVYPQYQDSSYFHDETGFSSVTPYGDSLDVLLSDAPPWLLSEYDTIVIASNITASLELKNNLEYFIASSNGTLAITAANLAQFPSGIFGVSTKLICTAYDAGTAVYLSNGSVVTESTAMRVCDLNFPANSTILAKLADGTPLVVKLSLSYGGSITVLATPFGVTSTVVTIPRDEIDVTFDTPYPLLNHAQLIFEEILSKASLFNSPANLSILATYVGENTYNVLVTNPELKEQPLILNSPQGNVNIIKEIVLDQTEKNQVGYLPDGYEGSDIGNSTNTTIAGGDTRLFMISLSSENVQLLPKVKPKQRPAGISLHLHHVKNSIRHEILMRPTFFQHYDSIVVDSSYLSNTDDILLTDEYLWLNQQNVSVYVDASPLIDLFPLLRLVNNSVIAYNTSLQYFFNLLKKMVILGSANLIVSLHRIPENDISYLETLLGFNDTLHLLLSQVTSLGISIHLRDTIKNPLNTVDLAGWLQVSGLSTIKIGLNTAIILNEGFSSAIETIATTQSSFIFISAPSYDMFGQLYCEETPLASVATSIQEQILSIITTICSLRQYCPYSSNSIKYSFVMDGNYKNADEEYADIKLLEDTWL